MSLVDMNQPTSQILSRLESLKTKRKEAQKLNRQALFQHSKNQRMATLKAKRNEITKESYDDYQDDKHGERQSNWHIKTKRDGSANFNDLAELTYYKHIDKLKIDKEAYRNQKDTLMQKHNADKEELGGVVDLLNKPDAKTKTEVVSFLSDVNDKRLKRKRKNSNEEGVDSFINEKNKQFNMKLNRQLNK